MLLHHLHLSSLTPYLHATALQSHLLAIHLASKTSLSQSSTSTTTPSLPPPPPTLLTFQTPPTYTIGRRDITRTTAADVATLRYRPAHPVAAAAAAVHASPRGGQTTFHGPGQATAFAVLDLRTHALTPRAHVRLLEEGVLRACARYGVVGRRTENPGVWAAVTEEDGDEEERGGDAAAAAKKEEEGVEKEKEEERRKRKEGMHHEERKLAAVGVQVRRGVTGYGVGINVTTDLGWFDRITACGLVGKRATSLERCGVVGVGWEEVAAAWVEEMALLLGGVDGVRRVGVQDVLGRRAMDDLLLEAEEEEKRVRWSAG